jgi:hypothetical protein
MFKIWRICTAQFIAQIMMTRTRISSYTRFFQKLNTLKKFLSYKKKVFNNLTYTCDADKKEAYDCNIIFSVSFYLILENESRIET